jgi:phosphatidylinositol-3-phosphatase
MHLIWRNCSQPSHEYLTPGCELAVVHRCPRVVASLVACLAAILVIGAAPAEARTPRLHHAWVFVMENHSLHQILGNPKAPFLNRIAHRYRVATRFYAPAHPSLPNYLAMISGSTHGCASDRCKGGFRGPTLARQLTARGLGWQGYFEGLPHRGYVGGNSGQYIRHHNPFVYFKRVTSNPRQRRHLRTLRAFPRSLHSPPALSYIVPDNRHNMHDGPIRVGDRWLARWVTRAMHSRGYRHGGVIFIVWDEGHNDRSGCCLPGVHGGRIPLFIISRHARLHHRLTHPRTTYSLLRSLESGFRLPHLGFAALTKPLPRVW